MNHARAGHRDASHATSKGLGVFLRATILCALAATAFAASFPGVNFWPATVLTPCFLLLASQSPLSTTRLAVLVFMTQWIAWFWLHAWLIDVSAAGWPLLAAVLALYPTLFVVIVRRWRKGFTRRWPPLIVVPLIWVALEVFRGEVFMHGYPWYLIGHPLIELPILAQIADCGGVYIASALVALVGAWLAQVATVLSRREPTTVLRRASVVVGLCTVAVLAYGWWRLSQSSAISRGPSVLAIQTNLPQSNKKRWEVSEQIDDVRQFATNTYEAFDRNTQPVDLIVWPETMVPGHGFEPATLDYLRELFETRGLDVGDLWARQMTQIANDTATPLLVGSPCQIGLRIEETNGVKRWAWDEAYNSVYLVLPGAEPPYARYDKQFLTPFGETMPYISAWPWLERQLLALGASGMRFDLDAGASPRRFSIDVGSAEYRLATPICFEATSGRLCRRLVWEKGQRAADLLVNLSNDGWFGLSDHGRLRHAQAARWRCIENRVPMMRVVNTGLTIAYDSMGNVIAPDAEGRNQLLRNSGSLTAALPLDARRPLYGLVGESFGYATLVGVLVIQLIRWLSGRRRKGANR